MKLDDLRTNKPSMPERMKVMVESKVNEQLLLDGAEDKERLEQIMVKRVHTFKKTKAADILVATGLATATTVVAGVQIAKMKANKVGEYAQEVTIETEGTEEGVTLNIPNVELLLSYLPDGAFKNLEEQSIQYEAGNTGAGTIIHYTLYRMDQGDNAFHSLDLQVLAEEEIQLKNTSGVYLELNKNFDKKVYLTFPDTHYVVELLASSELSKEEFLKVAEGIQLVSTEDSSRMESYINWSDAASYMEKNMLDEGEGVITSIEEELAENARNIVSNPYTIGESIPFSNDNKNYTMTVKDVQVYDDLHIIPEDERTERLLGHVDADGKLLPDTVSYIKRGDYVDTLDTTIDTEEVARKLVYVTIDVKNCSETDMEDILIFGGMEMVKGDTNDAQYWSEILEDSYECDYVRRDIYAEGSEMCWYSFKHQAGNGDNYIEVLSAGETQQVQIAYEIDEDQLPYMYMILNNAVIDIRQQ